MTDSWDDEEGDAGAAGDSEETYLISYDKVSHRVFAVSRLVEALKGVEDRELRRAGCALISAVIKSLEPKLH